MREMLEKHSTSPSHINIRGWKGNIITSMSTQESSLNYPGSTYWDFHRANLHRCLMERALELGAVLKVNSKVRTVKVADDGETATCILQNGEEHVADLIIGADGINSLLREIMLGRPDPPTLTGDLAYRVLLKTEDMIKDPELRDFVERPQVNYWLGPDAHAGECSKPKPRQGGESMLLTCQNQVNYVLKGGELFNMVLLVPDDMPEGANTIQGDIDEMCALYEGWDPRIQKCLRLCPSVHKWRLCIREGMDRWSHPSGAFTLMGDAVHATLPYLASG